MIILGIDPGSKESGYVYWDTVSQLITGYGILDNPKMLLEVEDFKYDILAIEVIRGYGIVAGDDTFDTCIWIGRFDSGSMARLIPRKKIKQHLCGNTTTNDKYVRQALIDRIGPQGTRKNPGPTYGISGHMWSALAVAVTAADSNG